jgi:hypothetical protein
MRRLPVILIAGAALAAAAPAAAHADSIAYVKDGNVWLSTGDGSRQFQVTTAGGYSDVSQADDGTMIAARGVRLQKLDRFGGVLADFDTPVSDTRPAGQREFFGPYDPAISPDGTRVAYTYYYMSSTQDPSCLPPTCVVAIDEGGTGYTRADRKTDWDEPGFAEHTGWRNPAWVDGDTTMLSDPTHLPNDDVVIDHPAQRAGATGFMANGWFSDTLGGNPHVGAGDITRDRGKLAFVTGNGDDHLSLYRIRSFPATFKDGEAADADKPELCYRYSGPNGAFGTPTFSPDGAHLAEAEADGIHVADVPSFGAGCTTTGASGSTRLLIPGASQPDWGPADVPTSRPAGGVGGGNGGGKHPGAGHGAPRLKVKAPSLARALRKGLVVRLSGLPAGKVRVTVRRGHATLGHAIARIGAKGTGTATVHFGRAARRALHGKRRVVLTVAAGGGRKQVTLKR